MDKENSIMISPSALPFEENSASRSALPFGDGSALPFSGSCVTIAAECEGKGGKNMAVDMKRKKQYDNEWQRQNCIRINFAIRNNTDTAKGILILKEKKIPVTPYIEKALHKQLIADGYLSPSDETEE